MISNVIVINKNSTTCEYKDQHDQKERAKLWGVASTAYRQILKPVAFTTQYCLDALDLTIGKDVQQPLKLLDVACGYGALTIPAAQRIAPAGGSIMGIDISPGMLEQLKIESQGFNNISSACMNGEDLQLEDNQFDYVYSAFGLILFSDRDKGLKELHRVVKKGGKATITSWPYDCEFFTWMQRSYRRISEDEMPDEAIKRITLGDGEFLRESFEKAGFHSFKVHTFIKVMPLPIDNMMEFFKEHPLIKMFQSYLPVEKKDLFHFAIRDELQSMFPNGKMNLHVRCAVAIGTK
ncbi:hypothetical protein PPL_00991 [Heterostelium album PN500]|uniref:Methyltransferase domain-containing protein n=1 Tax=Heterostelium pallidum (strain ATCC 26659 / Pp 5 / PN500) TaxID=670386 RepID=D3AXT4_HETP5|nr:hypothetical protein PPL_00991 [Heterostelium album PN500]EFA85761.1 hypothetical protein PPL_00991 [Heterostelium album PN500]|eukprot:XP_020437867.1 hypothetical protein PPL_00991 [Heterostelium album PN500]